MPPYYSWVFDRFLYQIYRMSVNFYPSNSCFISLRDVLGNQCHLLKQWLSEILKGIKITVHCDISFQKQYALWQNSRVSSVWEKTQSVQFQINKKNNLIRYVQITKKVSFFKWKIVLALTFPFCKHWHILSFFNVNGEGKN